MPLDMTTKDDNPFSKYNTPDSPILFPVAEKRVGWELNNRLYEYANTHKAIVRLRTEDGEPAYLLNIVGSGYQLVHNRELFTRVEDTMCKMLTAEQLDGVKVTDRVSSWGRMCYRDYVFPNIKCTLGYLGRSTIAFRLIVQNGYGGSALRVHAGAIDFYCSNGMISGDYTSTYRKHTSGLMVEGISEAVHRALDTFTFNQPIWHKWCDTPVTYNAAMNLFRELAQSTKLQENLADQYLKEREGRGDTMWALYSALTYYASHHDGMFALRSTVEQQDTVASTMLQRELNVAQWVKSDAWRKLEKV